MEKWANQDKTLGAKKCDIENQTSKIQESKFM